MKIKLKVEYASEDVKAIVIEAHVKRFGTAPKGMEWEAHGSYGDLTVEAVERVEEVSPASPTVTVTPDTTTLDPKEVF